MSEIDHEKDIKTIMAYRNVFNNPEGRAVLADIMNELGFISSHINTEAAMAMQNFARKLLWKCGIWRNKNVFTIIDKLFEVAPDIPEPKEKK